MGLGYKLRIIISAIVDVISESFSLGFATVLYLTAKLRVEGNTNRFATQTFKKFRGLFSKLNL